uniref:Ribosome biogenesis regulatory protein n=1 Tax=Pyramimonas obovata TaxID=1411642 RepID=A0A7S0WWL2_9CHLO|eukprot:CAMPEP_0118922954 /NCGR_PEP_ID=MMETSP1169-20130426/1677_1 /TAXON_ID=36882 /ORGANISM="Pyramimonas obovata, Strain CCMP722" /LENGTH=348 /DNA_ID=CAMNT_0006863883 /DNA_START=102 /DNA_END=1148 /DNA_ORIENTATION=+
MSDSEDEQAEGPMKITSAAQALQEEAFQGNLEMDLGNLYAYDPSPTDEEEFKGDPTETIIQNGTKIAQSLIGEIFKLPMVETELGFMAKLPTPSTPLPREKPFPKPKPMTKWEAFAKEKGITKRKRSKMEWDESAGEWRRRFGYKRVNDENDIIVVPAKPGDGADTDPFAEARAAKKERVTKNKSKELKNLQDAESKGWKVPNTTRMPSTLALTKTLGFEGSKTGQQGKKVANSLKPEVKAVKEMAALSTASVGKFDKKLKGEKEGRPKGKRRQYLPVTDNSNSEKKLLDATVTKVLKQEQKSILNMEKAVRNYVTDGHDANREKKRVRASDKGVGKKGLKEAKKAKK